MKRFIIVLVALLAVTTISARAQNRVTCTWSASEGWALNTEAVPYKAQATLDGKPLTSVHRFDIFYTRGAGLSGSVLTFHVTHSDDWFIPKGATIKVKFSTAEGVAIEKNRGTGKSESTGTFFVSDFSIVPDDGRLIYMDSIIEIETTTSKGQKLIIKPGADYQGAFDRLYFEACDALKAKGWTRGIM